MRIQTKKMISNLAFASGLTLCGGELGCGLSVGWPDDTDGGADLDLNWGGDVDKKIYLASSFKYSGADFPSLYCPENPDDINDAAGPMRTRLNAEGWKIIRKYDNSPLGEDHPENWLDDRVTPGGLNLARDNPYADMTRVALYEGHGAVGALSLNRTPVDHTDPDLDATQKACRAPAGFHLMGAQNGGEASLVVHAASCTAFMPVTTLPDQEGDLWVAEKSRECLLDAWGSGMQTNQLLAFAMSPKIRNEQLLQFYDALRPNNNQAPGITGDTNATTWLKMMEYNGPDAVNMPVAWSRGSVFIAPEELANNMNMRSGTHMTNTLPKLSAPDYTGNYVMVHERFWHDTNSCLAGADLAGLATQYPNCVP